MIAANRLNVEGKDAMWSDGNFADKLPNSLTERIKSSPIHQWVETAGLEVDAEYTTTDVEELLKYMELQASMSPTLRVPIHELLILRGEYPARMTEEQGNDFEARRTRLMDQLEVGPFEALWINDIFLRPVVDQWAGYSEANPSNS